MTAQDKNTESLILDAARKIFIEKGFEGARMQEIADTAGINKALLHYYYRGKDRLFEAVFCESFKKFSPRIFEIMSSSSLELTEKIRLFVSNYIDIILENPHIPAFVLHELNRNPDRIADLLPFNNKTIKNLLGIFSEEMKAAGFIEIAPEQFIINMIGLCIFPFIARPILQSILFENKDELFDEFIQSRKAEVTSFILNAVKKK